MISIYELIRKRKLFFKEGREEKNKHLPKFQISIKTAVFKVKRVQESGIEIPVEHNKLT